MLCIKKVKKTTGKIFAIIAIMGLLIYSLSSLETQANSDNFALWSIDNTTKIMRDIGTYDKSSSEVFIEAAKGEYEGGQFIITPSQYVSTFNVTVSNLTNQTTRSVLSNDNVSILVQKYINVTTKSNLNQDLPLGYYPDALIPIINYKNKGEDFILPNKNQGIWLSVFVPKTADAGIYTGSICITVAGVSKNIIIKVRVFNFTISDTTHMKSSMYIRRGQFISGVGLQDTDATYKKYYDFATQYRIAGLNLPVSNISTQNMVNYIQGARDANNNPRVSAFGLPVLNKINTTEVAYKDGMPLTNFYDLDYDYLKAFIVALAKASNVNENLLRKVYVFPELIDEPQYNNTIWQSNWVVGKFAALKQQIADQLVLDGSIALSSAMYNTILKIQLLSTAWQQNELTNIDTWCPTTDKLDSQFQRDFYNAQKETGKGLWWYTCSTPRSPFSTNHIDDNLISMRTLPWMAMEYGVEGWLNWSFNMFAKFDSNFNIVQRDVFSDPVAFATAPGDGYFVYPGTAYNLDSPISSLRLEAVRDGIEDYEYLWQLQELVSKTNGINSYYGINISAKKKISQMGDSLYSGTKPYVDDKKLKSTRRDIAEIIENFEESMKAYINTDYLDLVNNQVTLSLYAKTGTQIRINNELLTSVVAGSGIRSVKTLPLSQPLNTFDIEFKYNNEIKNMKLQYEHGDFVLNSCAINNGSIATGDPNSSVTFNSAGYYKITTGGQWEKAYQNIPPGQKDFSGYDYFCFDVYMEKGSEIGLQLVDEFDFKPNYVFSNLPTGVWITLTAPINFENNNKVNQINLLYANTSNFPTFRVKNIKLSKATLTTTKKFDIKSAVYDANGYNFGKYKLLGCKTITNIAPNTTISSFISEINSQSPHSIAIYDSNGNQKTNFSALIGTSDSVLLTMNSNTVTYSTLIYGDSDGDGLITIIDLSQAKQHLLKINQLSSLTLQAVDMNFKSEPSISDLLSIKKQLIIGSAINQDIIISRPEGEIESADSPYYMYSWESDEASSLRLDGDIKKSGNGSMKWSSQPQGVKSWPELTMKRMATSDWSASNYLKMDVYNPTSYSDITLWTRIRNGEPSYSKDVAGKTGQVLNANSWTTIIVDLEDYNTGINNVSELKLWFENANRNIDLYIDDIKLLSYDKIPLILGVDMIPDVVATGTALKLPSENVINGQIESITYSYENTEVYIDITSSRMIPFDLVGNYKIRYKAINAFGYATTKILSAFSWNSLVLDNCKFSKLNSYGVGSGTGRWFAWESSSQALTHTTSDIIGVKGSYSFISQQQWSKVNYNIPFCDLSNFGRVLVDVYSANANKISIRFTDNNVYSTEKLYAITTGIWTTISIPITEIKTWDYGVSFAQNVKSIVFGSYDLSGVTYNISNIRVES